MMNAQAHTIENFEDTQLFWRIINDGVMGGISSSRMTVLPDGNGLFSGRVSLENNGGFASTRALLNEKPKHEFDKVKIRVKGDGQKYSFRIRTDEYFDGVAYKNDFTTQKGEWEIVELLLADFIPVWRGRRLIDISPITPQKIRQVGFLISDKQAGEFSLLIDWIRFED